MSGIVTSPNYETHYDTLFVQYQNWQAPKKVKIKQRSAGQANYSHHAISPPSDTAHM